MASGKDLHMNEIHVLDKQIETLMECKPLPENEVKILCERVGFSSLILLLFLYIPCLLMSRIGQRNFDSRL